MPVETHFFEKGALALLKWDEANLEARLCRALDVARQTLNFFAIEGYTDKQSPVFGFGPEKPAAETAMLIYAASALGHRPPVASRIEDLARALVPHARSNRVLVDIALHPALAFKFAVPHVLLTRLGYRDEIFDAFLRSCISSQVRNGHDRPPSALVEKRWVSYLRGGHDATRVCRRDLVGSVLDCPLDILGGLRDDAYAFTHLMMYCTDFGYQTCRLPRRRSVILGEAGSLLARYIDVEDYDLAGEILLAWPLTGASWSASAAFAFRVLATVEDQAGILPCGNINLSRLTQLEGEERARYALGTAYHTAYVMGFLCASALRPGRMPPARIAGPQYERAFLDRLLHYVDDDQGHWQPVFSSLLEEEQRVLTPFILDIALMQSCRRHDYQAAGEIVSISSEYRIACSPMCRQAAELLERISACSTALSLRQDGINKDDAPLLPAVPVTSLQG
jgi:hypothetical protein